MRKVMVCLAGLFALAFFGGCSGWSYSKEVAYADGRIETIKAKQEQFLVWKDMKDVEVVLGDGSWVAVGRSKMDSDNAVEFVKALGPEFFELLKIWMKPGM